MKLRYAWLACCVALLQGCEQTPATVLARHPPAPAPVPAVYSELSPAARSYLSGVLDLPALDTLLSGLPIAERRQFLAAFRDVELLANPSGGPLPETTDVVIPLSVSDPRGQELLERMWSPYWRTLFESVYRDPAFPLPGQDLRSSSRESTSTAPRRCCSLLSGSSRIASAPVALPGQFCPAGGEAYVAYVRQFFTVEETRPFREQFGLLSVSPGDVRLLTDEHDAEACRRMAEAVIQDQSGPYPKVWRGFQAGDFYLMLVTRELPPGVFYHGGGTGLIVLNADMEVVAAAS